VLRKKCFGSFLLSSSARRKSIVSSKLSMRFLRPNDVAKRRQPGNLFKVKEDGSKGLGWSFQRRDG
jgi:hypothetical protein